MPPKPSGGFSSFRNGLGLRGWLGTRVSFIVSLRNPDEM